MAETSADYTISVLSSEDELELICRMLDRLSDEICCDMTPSEYNSDGSFIDMHIDCAADIADVCYQAAAVVMALKTTGYNDISLSIEGDIDEDYLQYTAFVIEYKDGTASIRTTQYSREADDDDEWIDADEAYDEAHEELDSIDPIDLFDYCEDEGIDLPDENMLDELRSIIHGDFAEEDEFEEDDE